MKRTDIINHFIKYYNYKKYLEIGVYTNKNFHDIIIDIKHGVDPRPCCNDCTYRMTSDEFFKQIDPFLKYDIIFIDGLHLTEQVDKDIQNALDHLSENGTIILHDCNPPSEQQQDRNKRYGGWTGDVWKSVAKIRMNHDDLLVYVIDTDYGCGVIQKTNQKQNMLDSFELTWENFNKNRVNILNLISKEDFIRKFNHG
ncbi:MAG: class I SAM-dependent methyltransferase [Clostridia bacterium]|nr:class I SAM-dependent methyltransferase [Clostridia bacterium]